MKYKVAQIIPYFGEWPKWIELYFYSCGRNPMMDFIFYTDCPLPKHLYPNIIFHQCSYDEYCDLVSERLDINFHCKNPYKLTDLKPFIGAVHESELRGYDFWGFGDLDLVYGDLNILVNDKKLERYDVITTHNYHIAGHFCLCKNNEYYNKLCFRIKDWKNKIESEKAMSIDELEWSHLVYPQLKNMGRMYKYILSHLGVNIWKYRDVMNKILEPHKHIIEYWTSPIPQDGQEWILDMSNGRIIDYLGRELPYLHFLFFKETPWLKTEKYWTANFWQLDEDFENYEKIIFFNNGVKGVIK